jgi:nitrogen fixation protein NifU and related proteins
MYPEPQFDDLYRQVILDHYRRPHNRHALEQADVKAEGLNPLCGDEIEVELRFDDGVVSSAAFGGRGCSISQSSASMMTDAVQGKTASEIESLIRSFKQMVMEGQPATDELGDLEALEGVSKFPVRVKCATLAWNVLQQAINDYDSAKNVTSPQN